MKEFKLPQNISKTVDDFINRLKDTYRGNLISVILYGSAASGEFAGRYSNVNLLVVLTDTSLDNLNKVSNIITRRKFQRVNPLFFTEDYIKSSSDVFPIEFLDMKENYIVLYGKDTLAGLEIDIINLRFQCEQELKAKLLNIKNIYLRIKDKQALENILFKSFTSFVHIMRNMVRLKGRNPSYLKEGVLADIAREFNMDTTNFNKILEAKKKNLKLSVKETESLFFTMVTDLENIINIVDKLIQTH
jgi:predicted nucleotidyltransferase